jgi:hypothetical protein
LQTGRAKSIHGYRRNRHRQTCANRRDPSDVVTGHAVRLATAQDYVFNFSRIELRSLAQNVIEAMRGQVIGPREIE